MKHKLTPEQAADILNVPSEHFLKLLADGVLPFEGAGAYKLVQASDIFQYKAKRDETRKEALKEIAKFDVESGLF